jgi:TetR/AcrR family transcriptional repressor of nem operon
MGSELVRADRQTRQAAAQGFHDLAGVLAKNIDRQQPAAARSQAVFAMAAMLGALTISRIIADPQASMLVLQEVEQHLNAM